MIVRSKLFDSSPEREIPRRGRREVNHRLHGFHR
jgi:hypothetical protein